MCILLLIVPCLFAQQASLTPSSLNFASQVVNLVSGGSPIQTVTLTNAGGANLVVRSILASGGYTQTNNCSTLVPLQTCAIQVRFVPGTVGLINGAITINDNTASSPEIVSLSGSGIGPVQLSPGTLRFGTIAVGNTSTPQVLRLTSALGTTVSVKQISLSGNFAQVNNCPSILAAGQSCNINIVFHPTASAAITGALAVSTSVGGVPLAVSSALTGTGSGILVSNLSVQPAMISFGNKGPDFTDTVKVLTVTNTSQTTSISIQNVSLAGSPNPIGGTPAYTINSNSCSGMLAPGGQCKISVAFSAPTSGRVFPQSFPGAVSITDSDPTSPQLVGISGTQVAQLTFSPTVVVFPPTSVGTVATKVVTVTGNDIQQGLVLDLVTSGDFSESGNLGSCLLTRGGQCTMTVSFSPGKTGVIKGAVTLETYPQCNPFPLHQCSDPIVLSLIGTGQ
jgi:hypothetical protein